MKKAYCKIHRKQVSQKDCEFCKKAGLCSFNDIEVCQMHNLLKEVL